MSNSHPDSSGDHFSLLTYAHGSETYNVGDYIQSLAARQYLTKVEQFLQRDHLAEYEGPPTRIIANGWYSHRPDKWIPSEAIEPLFISMHINSSAAQGMLSSTGIDYLKTKGPIGCRDWHTVELLKGHGLDAYFSGCLTLTLKRPEVTGPRRDSIYLVDPLFGMPTLRGVFQDVMAFARACKTGEIWRVMDQDRILRKLISPELAEMVIPTHQVLPTRGVDDAARFAHAQKLLETYAQASLVITSRIHCALPCLAMGTPVIFLNYFPREIDRCRFSGLLDLLHRVDIHSDGKITSTFDLEGPLSPDTIVHNMSEHLPLAAAMRDRCTNFVAKH